MAKEYVPIYFDWLDNTQDLTPEEKGNLIDAVVSYACGLEYEAYLTGGARIAFRFFKGQIDRNAVISEVRAKAGKTRHDDETGSKPEQNETNGNKQEQTETKIPKKKEEDKEKDKEKEKDILFGRFWEAYPRKVNKPAAKKAFYKLPVDEALLAAMLSAIARQKDTPQWKENGGQYIPHPATWLNGRRWEDEVAPGRNSAAANFEQRDYSNVPDEMVDELSREIEAFQRGAS